MHMDADERIEMIEKLEKSIALNRELIETYYLWAESLRKANQILLRKIKEMRENDRA